MYWCRNLSFNKAIIFAFLLLIQQLTAAQLVINEIAALNATGAYDPDFGEFADYLELYNTGNETINLKGYTLTDNPDNPNKWVFPECTIDAGSFLLLWADKRNKVPGDTAFCSFRQIIFTTKGLHTNFAFSGDGEYVGFYNPEGKLIDEIHFGVQQHDVLYGRNPQLLSEWLYFGDATPASSNSPHGAKTPVFSGDVTFSKNSGLYNGTLQLNLSSTSGSQIRYTTDGSTPNHQSTLYSDVLTLNRNTTVKARVYEHGKIAGPVTTRTYLINEDINLPVMSLSTNKEHLQDFDFGVLRNAIKEREVPVVLEYFDLNQQPGFSINAGLRLFGSTIYQLPQRPLSIRFKAKYGESELVYPLFEGRENIRYTSFLLRNGGNDHDLAYFRDGVATTLAKDKMDLDLQAYQPCVVFINGEYQGIYEMRERLDEDHLAKQHQLNSENIDLLEDSLIVAAGHAVNFRKLMDFVGENDLSKDENFNHLQSKIDVNEYINYLIHKIFIGYQLFDLNNRYWRPQHDSAQWRWIAADMEHAFGQLGGDHYNENTLAKVAGTEGSLPGWSTLLFRKLLQNKQFRDEFIQRSAAYLNSIYLPENTLGVVDSLQIILEPQMPRHIFKWKTPVNLNVWKGNVQFIRTFLLQRPAHFREHIVQQFGVTDSARVNLLIKGKGKVALAGVWHQSDSSSGHYFKGAALSLQAVPEHGHRFVGWETPIDSSGSIMLTADTTLVAKFEEDASNILPAVIAEDFRLESGSGTWYAVSDVNILPHASLIIDPGITLLMSDKASIHVQGGLQINGTEDSPVRIMPDPSPLARQPIHNNQPRWGIIYLDGTTERITISHAHLSGSGFGANRETQFSCITSINSTVIIANTTIDDCFQPFYSEHGVVHISHSTFRSVNTCDLINVKYNTGAIVEFCTLHGNDAPDTDAIDYDGVIDGIIRGNTISGFRGNNSDGIDVGESSKNLLIESNYIQFCTDKAISVGQASGIVARRNLITHCNLGIAVKDSFSMALIDQNTIYGTSHAIACYEKNSGKGGGQAVVKNSILSASMQSSIMYDKLSSIVVSFSLSDTDTLIGSGNLHANPQFSNASIGNFELKASSPSINAGDPFSPPDPDQTRADMGAYYVHSGSETRKVRINEINYHPASNYPSGDWIELYNQSNEMVDLSGWTIHCKEHTHHFSKGEFIAPGAFLVLAEVPDRFQAFHPLNTALIDEPGIELDNKAGFVSLRNANNALVHSVRYADTWPWPPLADGLGASLELEHLFEGNNDSDWRESYVLLGTPGAENSKGLPVGKISINEVKASNNSLEDEYGETDDWLELFNHNAFPVNAGGWYLTDKFTEPNKWQIPLNHPELTTIQPGGFLLIWADDQPEQGPLHAAFRLNAAGEELALYQRFHLSYTDIDRITYGPQNAAQSFGRYSDGADQLMLLTPTPGASNIRTSSEVIGQSQVSVAPNPFDRLTLFDTHRLSKPFSLYIRSASGALVWKMENTRHDRVVFERGTLKNGVYLYHIERRNNAPITGKLLIY